MVKKYEIDLKDPTLYENIEQLPSQVPYSPQVYTVTWLELNKMFMYGAPAQLLNRALDSLFMTLLGNIEVSDEYLQRWKNIKIHYGRLMQRIPPTTLSTRKEEIDYNMALDKYHCLSDAARTHNFKPHTLMRNKPK